jgi:hypothetical protein
MNQSPWRIRKPARLSRSPIARNVRRDNFIQPSEEDFDFAAIGRFGLSGWPNTVGGKEIVMTTDVQMILSQVARGDDQDAPTLIHDFHS